MSAHIIMKSQEGYIQCAHWGSARICDVWNVDLLFCLTECKKTQLCLHVCVHSCLHSLECKTALSINQAKAPSGCSCLHSCCVVCWQYSIYVHLGFLLAFSEWAKRRWRDPEKCHRAAQKPAVADVWMLADTAIMFPLCLQKHPFGFCLHA